MAFDPGLKIGQILKNADIVDTFKCGNMGGMRRSKTTNTLVIIQKAFIMTSGSAACCITLAWVNPETRICTGLKMQRSQKAASMVSMCIYLR